MLMCATRGGDAIDVAATRLCAWTNGACAGGEVVWSWRLVLACGAGLPTLRPGGQNDLLMTGQESPIAGEGEKGR